MWKYCDILLLLFRRKFESGKIPGWDEGVEITKKYPDLTEEVEDNIIKDEDESVEELQRALAKSVSKFHFLFVDCNILCICSIAMNPECKTSCPPACSF